MATVPLSGTNIRFLSGVPFQSDYKFTRWFDTITEQANWFAARTIVHSMINATPTYFHKDNRGSYIAVNKSIDDLWGTNYVMFQNASYNGKWFYAFVDHLEYVNNGRTNVYFKIDVLQTWRFNFDFKPSYVLREHCQLWQPDGTTPIINTQDEGLNYGSSYETVNVMNWKPYGDVVFLVIVAKSLLHDRDTGEKAGDIYPNINATPQPLCYYVHPIKLDGTLPNCWDGTDDIPLSNPSELLFGLYTMDSAVNDIVSIYLTDYIGFDLDVSNDSQQAILFPSNNFVSVNKAYNVKNADGTTSTKYFNTIFVTDMKNYIGKSSVFTNKYADYRTVKESKLLMYPYTVLLLDDLKGNRQTIKNEYIKGDDITVTIHGSLGTSNKTTYGIENYQLKDNLEPADWFYASLENSLVNNNPNDLPIVTDMLAAYLQGNRNSIQNQTHSTIFNGIMDSFQGITNAVTGGATGALQGAELGPAGAIAGGLEGSMGGTMQTVRGAGNTYFQLQGINAKQKDISNMPPSLAKLGGNTYFEYGHNIRGLYLIKKQITPEYQKKLEDFFNLFGYKVNEIKTPNFHTRQYWNYIQTSSCTILGDFNNEDLNELKSIFDSGITLWHTDDIGNYSLDNEVI